MFVELRTTRTGSMPDQACAPSRQFRWHGRHERKKFGFTAFLHEECETIPSTVSTLLSRDHTVTPAED